MAKPIALNLCKFCLLLLLLISSVNSMKDIEAQTDLQTGVNPARRSVTFQLEPTDKTLKKPEDDPLGKEVTQEELTAVDGDISAVYIIRVFDKRTDKLKNLEKKALKSYPQANSINDESNSVYITEGNIEVTDKKPKKMKTLKRNEEALKRELCVKILNKSKLSNEAMVTLKKNLCAALKDEVFKKRYLVELASNVATLQTKTTESLGIGRRLYNWYLKWQKKLAKTLSGRQQDSNPAELCNLRVAHVDLLKQIQLEVELHYKFKIYDALFGENIKLLEVKDSELQLRKMNKKQQQEVLQNKKRISSLRNLYNMAKNVYKKMKAVIFEKPFQNEDKFAVSLLEVAKIAADDEEESKNGIKQAAIEFLKKIFKIFDVVREIPIEKWRKDMHDKIHKELEMPGEWTRMDRKAQKLGKDKMLDILSLRVEMMLAETLLVYERLDKFYKIDDYYQMWKGKRMPKIKPYDLLKMYFRESEKKKPTEVVAGASPTAVHP